MTDYTAHGAVPVEDAATDDPPTVDEVADEQRRVHPEQVVPPRSPNPTGHPTKSDEMSDADLANGEGEPSAASP